MKTFIKTNGKRISMELFNFIFKTSKNLITVLVSSSTFIRYHRVLKENAISEVFDSDFRDVLLTEH